VKALTPDGEKSPTGLNFSSATTRLLGEGPLLPSGYLSNAK